MFLREYLNMILSRFLCCLALVFGCCPPTLAFLEQEVSFSEADVQKELAKRGPQEKRYGELLVASLPEPPAIRLGEPEGRLTVRARVYLSLAGASALPVDLVGTAGLRYDDREKAFYLDQPEAQSVHAPGLDPQWRGLIEQYLNRMLKSYFRKTPAYRLRPDASPQESTARWLLRSVRIEPGRVIAVLAPF